MPKSKKIKKKKGASGALTQPPEFRPTVFVRHTYRFNATAAVANKNISVGSLLEAAGMISTLVAGTTGQSISGSVQLHRISMWAPAPAAGSTDVDVNWSGTLANSMDDEKMSSTVGSAGASYYTSVPRPKTLATFGWNNNGGSGATVLCTLSCPINTIIDVDMTTTLANNIAGPAVALTGPFTSGNMAYGYLDGAASHQLQPLGLPGIF